MLSEAKSLQVEIQITNQSPFWIVYAIPLGTWYMSREITNMWVTSHGHSILEFASSLGATNAATSGGAQMWIPFWCPVENQPSGVSGGAKSFFV